MACNEASSRARPLRDDAAGFTLIELVAVIVILGVLAAVAVPVVTDLRRDARDQAHRATAFALRAGLDNARMAWRVRGTGAAVNDFAGWGDGTADFDASGWLVGTSYAGGGMTAQLCAEVWQQVLPKGPSISVGVPAQGHAYVAYYFPSVQCGYYQLDAGGQVMANEGGGNLVFITYDPSGVNDYPGKVGYVAYRGWDVLHAAP